MDSGSPVPAETPDQWLAWLAVVKKGGQLPEPASEEYARLVWAFVQLRVGELDEERVSALSTLPEGLRSLSVEAWVRRYLECAVRGLAGRPLTGGSRTAWLSAQRRARAAGVLPAGREMLLERLPGFSWNPDVNRWWAAFGRVTLRAAELGRIPSRGDDPECAAWLATQRLALRGDRLDPSRAAALAALPGWLDSLNTARARVVWERRLSELRAFLAADPDGAYPDPRSGDEREAVLGRWVHWQRECHRRADLSAKRVEELEGLPGWRWSTADAVFDRRVRQLGRELTGGPIPTCHRFYGWVTYQRQRHREGRLSDEQVAALESLNLLGAELAAAP